MKWKVKWFAVLAALLLVASACGDSGGGGDDEGTFGIEGDFKFGMILVGPQDDNGWSQAHFEAGEYVAEQTGAEMIVLDRVNTADRPEQSPDQVASDMIDQGADLVFFTSDDMRDGALTAAADHKNVPMIWSSGDSAWVDGEDYRADLTNLGNIMGEMEVGKMIAGCSAALTSQTGSIGYLGPLINDETRRLVNSAYLGARYCWEEYRSGSAADLDFEVTWIGFWFQIPGVTLDPTQVANEFFDGGADVVLSGIDTTQAIVVAGQRAGAGEAVWAVPYDFEGACGEAPEVCLGVPYFNWGPAYLDVANDLVGGNFQASFEWLGPDWDDINNRTTTAIGWVFGDGLSADARSDLEAFIDDLGSGAVNLWTGPLNWQDGSEFLADGEEASDVEVWYQSQLLEGVAGVSE